MTDCTSYNGTPFSSILDIISSMAELPIATHSVAHVHVSTTFCMNYFSYRICATIASHLVLNRHLVVHTYSRRSSQLAMWSRTIHLIRELRKRKKKVVRNNNLQLGGIAPRHRTRKRFSVASNQHATATSGVELPHRHTAAAVAVANEWNGICWE